MFRKSAIFRTKENELSEQVAKFQRRHHREFAVRQLVSKKGAGLFKEPDSAPVLD
jgi:hypothetical protein